VVRIPCDAGDDVGVAGLYGACGPPQGHDGARSAHWDVVEPSRRQSEMLGQADRRIREEREARNGEAVDILLADARAPAQFGQGTGKEPMGIVVGVPSIRHGHRDGDRNAFVGCPLTCHDRL
jgi:hypothetical protein